MLPHNRIVVCMHIQRGLFGGQICAGAKLRANQDLTARAVTRSPIHVLPRRQPYVKGGGRGTEAPRSGTNLSTLASAPTFGR